MNPQREAYEAALKRYRVALTTDAPAKERVEALLQMEEAFILAVEASAKERERKMHAFGRVVIWLVIMAFILFAAHFTPKQETAFQLAIALTFMVWLLVGFAYSVRGVWRFLRS